MAVKVVDLGPVRGPTGPTGPKGDPGATGPAGTTSAAGLTGTLPISKGGTGATTAAAARTALGAAEAGHTHTFDSIAFLGYRPVKSQEEDTIPKWVQLGTGYAYYDQAGLLLNQPNTWGILISYIAGYNVFQIWRSQSGGPTYWRSGNGNGWAKSWTKVYDEANKPTAEDVGAAASSHTHTASQCNALQHIDITAASDFNDLIGAAGATVIYTIKVSGCTNAPCSNWGTLIVSKPSSATHQLYIPDSATTIYSRVWSANAWKNWVSCSLGGHTHAATDIASGTLPIARGGTGATTAAAARTALGAAGVVGPTTVTLTSSLWIGGGPWVQTATVSGVTATDYHLHVYPVSVADAAARKLYEKAYGCLDVEAESVRNGVKFTCRTAKPATNFQVIIEGVR